MSTPQKPARQLCEDLAAVYSTTPEIAAATIANQLAQDSDAGWWESLFTAANEAYKDLLANRTAQGG